MLFVLGAREALAVGYEEFKERSRRVWGAGDYGPTSRQLAPASEALVDALGIEDSHRVLDVAAGDGNCVVAAARRGASVCASDFSPHMIAAGRARTALEGLAIEWRQADAADLPFPDGAYDRVTSVFGAIFAPEQEACAAELARVTRTGGMIGLTAWTADGFTSQLLGIYQDYAPAAPADAPDPLRWGRPDEVIGIFAALGCTADIRQKAVTFWYPSWLDCRRSLEAHGTCVTARQGMPAAAYEEMLQRVRALTGTHNRGEGAELVWDAEYLEVLVTKP